MHPRHMIPHFMLALAASAALTSCGGGGSGSSPPTPPAPPPAGLLSVFAGDLGGEGNVNGSGAAARFSYPSANQMLMRAYGDSGRQADALVTYRRCCAQLQAALGVRPAAATEALRRSVCSVAA